MNREFLDRLRVASETRWSELAEPTLGEFERAGVGGRAWRRNTKWTGGLSAAEISAAETRYDLHFPPNYRTFLSTLHATEPKMFGAGFVDAGGMQSYDHPGFFDWRSDDTFIRNALAWPLDGILFDVENNALWPTSWGPPPDSESERRARVSALVAAAPQLIPVIGHRYLLAREPYPILSVWQSDIIVYKTDLASLLIEECDVRLDHEPPPYPDTGAIPFWGELIG